MAIAAAAQHDLRLLTMQELGQQTSKVMNDLVATGTPALVTKRGRFIAMIVPLAPGTVEDAVLARADDILVPWLVADVKLPSHPIEEVIKHYGLNQETMLRPATARSDPRDDSRNRALLAREAGTTGRLGDRPSDAPKPSRAKPVKKVPAKTKKTGVILPDAPRGARKPPIVKRASSGAMTTKKATAKKAPSKAQVTTSSRDRSAGGAIPSKGSGRKRSV